jgi:hypothetical protein
VWRLDLSRPGRRFIRLFRLGSHNYARTQADLAVVIVVNLPAIVRIAAFDLYRIKEEKALSDQREDS